MHKDNERESERDSVLIESHDAPLVDYNGSMLHWIGFVTGN